MRDAFGYFTRSQPERQLLSRLMHQVKESTLPETTQKLLADAAIAIAALREYIQAIPEDVVASLPVMPGIDGDWLAAVQENLRLATN